MYKNQIKYHFKCFGTLCEISFADDDLIYDIKLEKLYSDISELVRHECMRIQNKFSRYNQEGVVFEINQLKPGKTIQMDEETQHLFQYAQDLYQMSDGLFDITSGILRKIWNFKNTESLIPSQNKIDHILGLIGFDKIEVNKHLLTIKSEGVEVDFGGFGKEYAVDKSISIIINELNKIYKNKTGVCLNFGGDIFTINDHQMNKNGWDIAVANPLNTTEVIKKVNVVNESITTSGDYERGFTINGKRYSHILNPKTGYPVDYWRSISVISPSCLASGAISTIAMLKEKDAIEFLEKQNVAYLAIKQKANQVKVYKNHLWNKKEIFKK